MQQSLWCKLVAMNGSSKDITTLGMAYGRYACKPFGIHLNDRLQHIYIIGQTGTGKSTLLYNLMCQDLRQGHGFCLVDPHGDLAKKVAETCPDRAIIWNVADPDSPYGYNPITHVSEAFRPLLAAGLIETLQKQWSDAWGARMEHLLRYAVLALLEQPKADMRDVMRLFLEKSFRQEVLSRVTDAQVLEFWQKEFPAMNYKTAFDGVAPIANKLGAFLAHPLVRRAICEPKIPLRMRAIMDEGGILVVNLAKGQLGAGTATVLGGLIVSGMAHAAYSRHSLPESERKPFFLYVDEFHSFTTEALADMLSELRKYKLSLTLANQYLAQIEDPVLKAVFGNAGTLVCFRAGALDAPVLAKHMVSVRPEDVVSLPNYQMFIRLMVNGERTKAFTAWGLGDSIDVWDPQKV